jgi:hypothetical protein
VLEDAPRNGPLDYFLESLRLVAGEKVRGDRVPAADDDAEVAARGMRGGEDAFPCEGVNLKIFLFFLYLRGKGKEGAKDSGG